MDTPPPAPAIPPAPPTPPWYDGVVIGEDLGHFQNRGYDKMTPAAAALAASKAHREAEKLIGAPANELLRMPKDAGDTDGWARVRNRFNVPNEAKDYDFSTVKRADGVVVDKTLIDALAPVLHRANVSKDVAPDVAKAIVTFLDSSDAAKNATSEATLNAERESLKVNWGANTTQNMMIAKNAAKALKIAPEAVAALEKTVGYSKVMEMFREIGVRIGEDKFITNDNGGNGPTVMSKDQAKATLAERENDTAWVARLNASDPTAIREFDTLTRILSSQS